MGKKRRIELLSKSLLKVNIGCTQRRLGNQWINMDLLDLAELCQAEGNMFMRNDPRRSLPFQADTVDMFYSAYYIQTLHPIFELVSFLRRCREALKPQTGVFRMLTYNLQSYLGAWTQGDNGMHRIGKKYTLFDSMKSIDLKLSMLLFHNWEWQNSRELYLGNQAIYTTESLKELLQVAGFSIIKTMPFGKSDNPILEGEVEDTFPEEDPIIYEVYK